MAKEFLCGPKAPTEADLEEVALFREFLAERSALERIQTSSLVICPECVAGKHGNCLGDALDPESDTIVDCQCVHGASESPSQKEN